MFLETQNLQNAKKNNYSNKKLFTKNIFNYLINTKQIRLFI